MIIIGELINASRKAIGAAIEARDAAAIQKVAEDQHAAGANFIDVNAGIFVKKEPEYLAWLVQTVQEVIDGPCAIDSPNPKAIEAALAVHQGTPMINSISLEKERYENLMPIIAGTDMKVIALCMSDEGMPKTVEDRLKIADRLVNGLLQNNVKMENIFVDPLVQPLSVDDTFGTEFTKAVEQLIPGTKRFKVLSQEDVTLNDGTAAKAFTYKWTWADGATKLLTGALISIKDDKFFTSTATTILGGETKPEQLLELVKSWKFY